MEINLTLSGSKNSIFYSFCHTHLIPPGILLTENILQVEKLRAEHEAQSLK